MRTLFVIFICSCLATANARTIIVGKGLPVSSLVKGITLASPGDTILIRQGIYREGAITLTKPLAIIGEGNVILDGEKKYEILLISTRHCTIKGITFQNSGYSALNDYASIKLINCSDITLEGNTILNAYFAIHISNSFRVAVRKNHIIGNPSTEQL